MESDVALTFYNKEASFSCLSGYYYPIDKYDRDKNFTRMILFIGDNKGSLHTFSCLNERFFSVTHLFKPRKN